MTSRKHPVVEYCHGVLDGTTPACGTIRQAVERHIRDLETGRERGLHFDRQVAEYAVNFFRLLKHSKGEWAGRPFEPAPWQQFITWNLFGWKREDGLRRFRTAFVMVPRKNGKTTWLAAVGLFLLTADGEPGAEVYSAATKKDQAKISWEEAVRMRAKSPVLSQMVQYWRGSDTLAFEAVAGRFKPLGADADTLDGLNVHGALIDELHAHRSGAVVDVLETATGARRQPLIVEITTAGYDRESVCYAHYDYSRQVLSGSLENDTWFSFVGELDEGDDWEDEAAWAKANPNLGISVKLDDLRAKKQKAREMPMALNAFLRLHLNVWTVQAERWIDPDVWEENAAEESSGGDLRLGNRGAGELGSRGIEEMLRGRRCYGGLDLSSVSDLTAWVMVFPHGERFDILCRFWAPEAKLEDWSNPYREQYQGWVRDGWLKVTPGNAVDYESIKAQMLDDARHYELVDLNVDRLFQGYQLSAELVEEGLKVFGFGMGFLSMAPAMKTFERLLLERRLNHFGNPVLRWMAGNVAVKQDPAGNLKPDKASSQGKIDGIVALLMALDRAERNDGPSVYEGRGVLVL